MAPLRKNHRKSRNGCIACKARHIKVCHPLSATVKGSKCIISKLKCVLLLTDRSGGMPCSVTREDHRARTASDARHHVATRRRHHLDPANPPQAQ